MEATATTVKTRTKLPYVVVNVTHLARPVVESYYYSLRAADEQAQNRARTGGAFISAPVVDGRVTVDGHSLVTR